MKKADREFLLRQITERKPADKQSVEKANRAAAEADELRTEGHHPTDKPRVGTDDSP